MGIPIKAAKRRKARKVTLRHGHQGLPVAGIQQLRRRNAMRFRRLPDGTTVSRTGPSDPSSTAGSTPPPHVNDWRESFEQESEHIRELEDDAERVRQRLRERPDFHVVFRDDGQGNLRVNSSERTSLWNEREDNIPFGSPETTSLRETSSNHRGPTSALRRLLHASDDDNNDANDELYQPPTPPFASVGTDEALPVFASNQERLRRLRRRREQTSSPLPPFIPPVPQPRHPPSRSSSHTGEDVRGHEPLPQFEQFHRNIQHASDLFDVHQQVHDFDLIRRARELSRRRNGPMRSANSLEDYTFTEREPSQGERNAGEFRRRMSDHEDTRGLNPRVSARNHPHRHAMVIEVDDTLANYNDAVGRDVLEGETVPLLDPEYNGEDVD